MSKTTQLNELFERWRSDFPGYRGKFCQDGIVNEFEFEITNPKILFLTKEPNDPEQKSWDFRTWWSKSVDYSFARRICQWAFGVLNGFPPLSQFNEDNAAMVKVMNGISFMNLKKSGGNSSADHDVIRRVIREEREFILEEISIIAPDLIIGGIGRQEFWKILFPDVEFRGCGYDIDVARRDSFKIVDFYHPSYRVPRAMSYCLLKQVMESDAYRKL